MIASIFSLDNFPCYKAYFRYVLRHKYLIAKELIAQGMYLRAFTHDLSKFLPSEFFSYARYFYLSCGIPRTNFDEVEDRNREIDHAFHMAWNLHWKRNRHHWEWWIFNIDRFDPFVMPMDEADALEMIADWRAMGAAGKSPLSEWYAQNKDRILLHHDTKVLVESEICYFLTTRFREEQSNARD